MLSSRGSAYRGKGGIGGPARSIYLFHNRTTKIMGNEGDPAGLGEEVMMIQRVYADSYGFLDTSRTLVFVPFSSATALSSREASWRIP